MREPFVVPEGVVFLIEADGVTIENQGDVVLHTDFGGRTLKRIKSHEGSIALHTAATAGALEAAGEISVAGGLAAESVTAGGALRVDGALSAATVAAGTVRSGGDLAAGRLHSAGDVSVGGALSGESAEIAGNLHCASTRVPTLTLGGNLSVDGDAELGALSVGGDANFGGNVTGGTIRAQNLTFGGGTVTARGIQGSASVRIGAARLTVDAILAPEVHLDARTSGRVTVVESFNEVGASAIKGGFRLADYAEMFGGAESFLAERGLSALGEAGDAPVAREDAPAEVDAEPEAAPAPEAAAEETGDPESIEANEASEAEEAAAEAEEEAAEPETGPAMINIPTYAAPVVEPEPEAQAPAEAPVEAASSWSVEAVEPAAAPVEAVASWSVEAVEPAAEPVDERPDPVSVAAVEEEAAPEVEAAPAGDPLADVVEHPMHAQLTATIQRIVDCYAGAELPGAVERLSALAESRLYTEIRAEITNIWSELLKYHQRKGIRIHPMVTTTFNSVNSLVKKM